MKTFINYAENLRMACINQRTLIYALLLVLTITTLSLAYLATHHAVFLVPYGLDKKVAVSIERVTPAYLSQLALSDAGVYFNVDPSNVQAQGALFLSRVDPAAFGDVSVGITARNKEVMHQHMSQAFYVQQRYIKKNTQEVVLKGVLRRWLSDKLVVQKPIVLTVVYKNRQGRLWIDRWGYQDA